MKYNYENLLTTFGDENTAEDTLENENEEFELGHYSQLY